MDNENVKWKMDNGQWKMDYQMSSGFSGLS